MKLSLNLFTHRLNVELRRKRRLLTLGQCAKEAGLKYSTIRNYPYCGKVKARGTAKVKGHNNASVYDIKEVIAATKLDFRRKQR